MNFSHHFEHYSTQQDQVQCMNSGPIREQDLSVLTLSTYGAWHGDLLVMHVDLITQ